jgi:hypothetical protein
MHTTPYTWVCPGCAATGGAGTYCCGNYGNQLKPGVESVSLCAQGGEINIQLNGGGRRRSAELNYVSWKRKMARQRAMDHPANNVFGRFMEDDGINERRSHSPSLLGFSDFCFIRLDLY